MNKLNNRQLGFGAVGILAVVAAIAVIGLVGFRVLRNQHKQNAAVATTPASPSSASPIQTPTNPPGKSDQPAQQYLSITEWGVKLTLDNNTSTMYYYIKPSVPNVAYLSLKTVSDIAPKCAASAFSLAAIGRLTEEEQAAAVKNPSAINQPGTVHIGNYWYSFGASKARCTDTSAQDDAITKAQAPYDLESVFKTIQTSPATSTN